MLSFVCLCFPQISKRHHDPKADTSLKEVHLNFENRYMIQNRSVVFDAKNCKRSVVLWSYFIYRLLVFTQLVLKRAHFWPFSGTRWFSLFP